MPGHHEIEFDVWFQTVWQPSEDDDVLDTGKADGIRAWFRSLYDAEGPVDLATAEIAYGLGLLDLAEQAIEVVLDDVRRTANECPTVTIDVPAGWDVLVISYFDGGQLTSASWMAPLICPDRADMVAEIASDVQEHMCEAYGYRVWPLCDVHGFGLHATVEGGESVWWCRYGGHRVAAIGALDS